MGPRRNALWGVGARSVSSKYSMEISMSILRKVPIAKNLTEKLKTRPSPNSSCARRAMDALHLMAELPPRPTPPGRPGPSCHAVGRVLLLAVLRCAGRGVDPRAVAGRRATSYIRRCVRAPGPRLRMAIRRYVAIPRDTSRCYALCVPYVSSSSSA